MHNSLFPMSWELHSRVLLTVMGVMCVSPCSSRQVCAPKQLCVMKRCYCNDADYREFWCNWKDSTMVYVTNHHTERPQTGCMSATFLCSLTLLTCWKVWILELNLRGIEVCSGFYGYDNVSSTISFFGFLDYNNCLHSNAEALYTTLLASHNKPLSIMPYCFKVLSLSVTF